MQVSHYGLHETDGGIALLAQQARVDHVLDINIEPKLVVKPARTCTHQIDLASALYHPIIERAADEPLFKAMLPLPNQDGDQTLFVEDGPANRDLLLRLSRLSSPGSYSIMVPIFLAKPSWLFETNIQPLVVYGHQLDGMKALNQLMDAAMTSPRRLIALGPRMTSLGGRAVRVTTNLTADDFAGVNMEALGAWALKEHMLGKR